MPEITSSKISSTPQSFAKEIELAFAPFKEFIDKYPHAIQLSYEAKTGYTLDINFGILERLPEFLT